MKIRRRPLLLVSLMTACVALVAGLSLWLLYEAAYAQQRDRLVEVAQSQAQLILSLAEFDRQHGHGAEDSLAQVRSAHENFRGFGETGEFTLARRQGDKIVFLLGHRHFDLATPKPVPISSTYAEPMRRALRGESGTVVGLDYRGVRVLAAHEPLPALGWGIVAKIDLAEVRAPFLRAGAIATLTAALLVSFATLLFFRITSPLIERVEESEGRYRRLVESQQDFLLVLDADLRVTFANGVVKSTFERGGRSLREDGLEAVIAPKDLATIEDGLRRALAPPYHFVHESQVDDDHWIAWSGGAVRGDRGEVRGLMLVGRDVSAKKRADAELLRANKLESVGTLAGGVAHDLNNILTSLFGNLSLARLELNDEHPALEFVEAAESSMARAKALSMRLLTFAKGGDPVTRAAQLGELVRDTVQFHLSGSNVKPVFDIPEDLWLANIDPGQLEQVFANLTVNANQAMAGGGHLRIRLENVTLEDNAVPGLASGRYVRAFFTDDGPGIPEEALARIFDPYFTTKQSGSGLGLAISHSIVGRHAGHLGVSSHPGEGTTFVVYVPASNAQALRMSAPREIAPPAALPPASVLVMDDEPTVRTVLERMLQSRGMTVDVTSDGKDAIAAYRQAQAAGRAFDLVITDLTVPGGLGGLETLEGLQQIDTGVRVVASSGYADNPVMANYSAYGFIAVLPKPYKAEELDLVLRQALSTTSHASGT